MITATDLTKLPVAVRLQLMERLWQSLEHEALPVPQWQQDELRRRLAAHAENPSAAEPWEVVKARLLAELAAGPAA
jgi:putative addiction module component (TIGR02574 family)